MSEQRGRFERVLTGKDALALAFGAMIGWGWIVLAGTWVTSAGSLGAVLAFLLGGVAILLIGLTYSELAAAMPKVGGEHVYSYRALGIGGSFVCTWSIVLGYVSVIAFEAVALPTVVEHLLPDYKLGYLWTIAGWDVYATWVLVGVAGSIAMTLVNYFGVTPAALLQKVVTLGILAGGLLFFAGALKAGEVAHLEPLFADGAAGVMSVLIMVPFLFVGFDVIPQAAEEIDLPAREIGRILVVSVAMAILWYALIALGVGLSMNADDIASSQLVVADATSLNFGSVWAGKLLILAGIGGIITSWNAFFVGASRAVYALAHARMLPAFLARLHPRYNTPYAAILMIGAISCVAPFLGRRTLVWWVDVGGLGVVVAYALVAVSFLKLRAREPEMPRPFRVRWGRAVGWTALILAIGMAFLYLPGSPSALLWPQEWIIFLAWMILGIVLYRWAQQRYGSTATARAMAEELP